MLFFLQSLWRLWKICNNARHVWAKPTPICLSWRALQPHQPMHVGPHGKRGTWH